MFKIFDLYIGKTIIGTTFLTLSTLVGLSAIIKYVEQLRKVGKGSYDLLQALYYVVLDIPSDIEAFFPMATLLGALIALGILASSSELTVMQAAGFSKLDVGLSVLKTALPLMLVVMVLGEWGTPQATKMAKELRAFAISGGHIVSVRSGVWARDGKDFIFMARVSDDELQGVNVWKFDENNTLEKIIHAKTATYVADQTWLMKNGQITNMDNDIALSKQEFATYNWQTTIAPDKLDIVTTSPDELPLSGVFNYIKYLEESEQDSSKYELVFWRKLSQPLSIAVMMLMALSFVFGPLRSVTMGARILSGIVAGFAFYIASEFFGPLSLVYKLPAVVGAVAPNLIALLVTILLLRRKL